MRLAIWNVNGFRSCLSKGWKDWYKKAKPDILGLQEVRAFPDDVEPELLGFRSVHRAWNPAQRPGYSGVGLLSRLRPKTLETTLGVPEFDVEGRVQIADFERFVFFNVYFPKGSGNERDNSRVPYKLAFYDRLLTIVKGLRTSGRDVIIGGDWNTAPTELDLTNWKTNRKTSGFLPEECEAVRRFLDVGLIDVFRAAHPGEPGHHTWWSQRQGARQRNVGWRIDYFLVSPAIAAKTRRAWISPETLGSDHCPVLLDLD